MVLVVALISFVPLADLPGTTFNEADTPILVATPPASQKLPSPSVKAKSAARPISAPAVDVRSVVGFVAAAKSYAPPLRTLLVTLRC
jgi:hypothetical protein